MILIDNRQEKIEVTNELEEKMTEIIEYTLSEEKVNIPYEVSIIFVDNDEIKLINSEQRGIDRTTDVLSFPMLDYEKDKYFKDMYSDYKFEPYELDDGKLMLGDMALSLERAKEQCIEYGHSFIREVMYLTVHSMLHLLGYDHMQEDEKKIMRNREEEIMTKFNIIR